MPATPGTAKAATCGIPAVRKYSAYPIRYDDAGTAALLPTLAGSGSRPAGGSATPTRGDAGNAGFAGPAGAPPPAPRAGATITGSVIGASGSSPAAIAKPGGALTTDGPAGSIGGITLGGNCICGGSGRPDGGSNPPPPPPPPPPGPGRPGGLVVVVAVVVVAVVSVVVVRVVDVWLLDVWLLDVWLLDV
jgi:hypothetical protein